MQAFVIQYNGADRVFWSKNEQAAKVLGAVYFKTCHCNIKQCSPRPDYDAKFQGIQGVEESSLA